MAGACDGDSYVLDLCQDHERWEDYKFEYFRYILFFSNLNIETSFTLIFINQKCMGMLKMKLKQLWYLVTVLGNFLKV